LDQKKEAPIDQRPKLTDTLHFACAKMLPMKKQILCALILLLALTLGLEVYAADPKMQTLPDNAASVKKQEATKTITNTGMNLPKASTQPLDPTKFSISKTGIIIPDYALHKIACAQAPNGKIIIIGERKTIDEKYVGEAIFLDNNFGFIKSTYYTFPTSSYQIGGQNSVLALDNNTFLIAYNDTYNGKAKYVLLNSNGNPMFEPKVFCESIVDSLKLTPLPGKKTLLLSYQKYSDISAQAEYQILDLNGDKTLGPIVFNTKGMGFGFDPIIKDGLITFYFGCGMSRSKTIDLFGNVVRDDTTFWHKPNKTYSAVPLLDGNTLVLCVDENYKPMGYFLNPQGERIGSSSQIINQDFFNVRASRLASGKTFLFLDGTGSYTQRRTFFTVMDGNGMIVKEIKPTDDTYFIKDDCIGYGILNSGKALIVYSNVIKTDNGFTIKEQFTGYKVVNLD
jgi:hypothetical protein